ncbi:MAG TPA: ATP-dependent sacrificial sulfur transferase LarE [Phycisphaerae bacterium]|nr:ATP-dependent sacrificial sulfur transferase LarE [Phycisphaerae bacterium]
MTKITPGSKLDAALREKADRCGDALRAMGGVVVAVSGGVDSALLVALAAEALGPDHVLAAHATGPLFPRHERAAAHSAAERARVELVEIEVSPWEDPKFAANPPDRCFLCKTAIFGRLQALAAERQMAAVASGTHADDVTGYRPGLAAEEQLGVRRPLLEAGLTKADIRALSRAMGLPSWNAPSLACLASRIPYGETITPERLARIDRAEQALRAMGFSQLRVRDHGGLGRIEVPPEEIPLALARREAIVSSLKEAGYPYVALDLEGYRSGSMDEVLD